MARRALILLLAAAMLNCTLLVAAPASQPDLNVACDVTVDGRVELICLLFKLAGTNEYNLGRITRYEEAIERHFGPHREHEAVKLAQKMARHGARYDAPMSLAAHLTPLPELGERLPFEPRPRGLDSRLQPKLTREFLVAARQFVEETNFEQFLASQQELHQIAVERMTRTLSDHVRLDWFDAYFGPRAQRGAPDVRFHLVIGLQNGPCNYGASVVAPDGEHLYSIMGAWEADREGLPRFGRAIVPVVIHEFAHSYVNPIVDEHLDALKPAGQKLFARTETAMRAQAYGQWETVMRESVVRACVARYRLANDGPLALTGEIAEQSLRGFTWMGALSQRLAEYESDRRRYPTFDAFMPRIVEFFDEHAAHLDQVTAQDRPQ